jgi:L-lactate dehydrogenase complex protein LldF
MKPEAFSQQIQKALANPDLQAALDANAERRILAGQQSRASLPEPWEVMRRKAHEVRAEIIENLDNYLEQFTGMLKQNGVIVHHAENASQAAQIVLEIAQRNHVRLVAKSKSMVSEEIELNHVLEEAGIDVVETDLGEYIVQLRHERPAHIITPAVHLRRREVGQTFHEKLGIPLTEDIPTLTAVARQRLRQVFLKAGMGVSGVNFGVAETGTLCMVTNEGNGRMCTTLPRIHVALMGIERLVPSLQDLALMLYLLPRSATGQKLTVYTNLMHGPRRPGDPDGPQERHLVLVDNGRAAMRQSPLSEALLCIRCGACINACPIFREIGGHGYAGVNGGSSTYPGPIGSVVAPGLFGQEAFGHLARASSLCGACKEVCPVDIDLPKLLLRVRAGLTPSALHSVQSHPQPNAPKPVLYAISLYSWFGSSRRRFVLAQKAAALASRLAAPFLRSPFGNWLRLPAFTGWGYSKDFPIPASHTFRDRFASRQAKKTTAANAGAELAQQHPASITSPEISPTSSEISEITPQDLTARFASELEALGGHVSFCTPQELASRLTSLLQERNIRRIQSWDANLLPEGLLNQLQDSGFEIIHEPDPDVQAGLTGALAGIAETGTLVLTGGPGRPLTASLLAPLHIAILRGSDIFANLRQAFGLPEIQQSPAAVLISGPSRTADIEMTLTIGVHGPGELHVICLAAPDEIMANHN